MKLWPYFFLFFTGSAVIASCKKQTHQEEPYQPSPFQLTLPANFPAPQLMPSNPLTKEGVELGRSLFYDVILSANYQVSCASCHLQQLAFTDAVALGDNGVSGKELVRHSPPLFNLAWASNGLFWDGGSTNLESQAFAPITHADEMALPLFVLEARLKADQYYTAAFQKAFSDGVKVENAAKALAQFQRTLISAGSRYDKFIRNEPGGYLSAEEQNGRQLIQQKCQPCHAGDLFTDNQFHNNGLDNDFSNDREEGAYQGRFRITNNSNDLGAFKTPSLRNIMLTAPYMHDGRIPTIEAVLDHYSSQVKYSPSLSKELLKNGDSPGISITKEQKQAIIGFLHTLTDETFINNPDFNKK